MSIAGLVACTVPSNAGNYDPFAPQLGSSSGDADPTRQPANDPPSPGSTSDEPAGSTSIDEPGTTTTDDDESGSGDPPPLGLGCEGRDDLLLCDDFEDGEVDTAVWNIVQSNGGEVHIDGQYAYHGRGALRVHLPSTDGARGGLRTAQDTIFPVADNHLFGRAYFYVDPAAPETHSAAFAARGQMDGATAHYRLDSNGGEFNSRYSHTPSVEQHGGLKKFGYDVPSQQWLCIEWEYDGGHDTMRYWMNGDEVEDMTVTEDSEEQPWVAPVFEHFEIGYLTYQAAQVAQQYDVVWDAVALSSTRIGCE